MHVNITILVRQRESNIETFIVIIDQNYTRQIESNYEKNFKPAQIVTYGHIQPFIIVLTIILFLG